MSFIRKDIFTGAYIIISEVRGMRPLPASETVFKETPGDICPFCPDNEYMTPIAVDCEERNWQTRFFPNKYPALTESLPLPEPDEDSFYGQVAGGAGAHEVLVDTRSHCEHLKDFSIEHIVQIIRILAERYDYYAADDKIKYIQIFKNKGARAGASQSHSHWQLVAGTFVPLAQQILSERLSGYSAETGRCLYCDVLEKELRNGRRIIIDNGPIAAFAPYASRFSYETWIMPKRHITSISDMDGIEVNAFAQAVKLIAVGLERIKQGIDYNILFMGAPKTEACKLFHWHMQILPKMGSLAGYEYATGSYINHITPEKAAERLGREI